MQGPGPSDQQIEQMAASVARRLRRAGAVGLRSRQERDGRWHLQCKVQRGRATETFEVAHENIVTAAALLAGEIEAAKAQPSGRRPKVKRPAPGVERMLELPDAAVLSRDLTESSMTAAEVEHRRENGLGSMHVSSEEWAAMGGET